ncbi:hypothetical protein SASPL_100109 [Salvia splendens]|uniref:Rieske-like [2Fe-2S] domain-containing protein n=1 Tax=Salvia splendens TaxID=180675 RepID=A0A8X9ACX9_SALSN|nr:hypothetical protein SASPL_100109 [Salvia splendens]
MATAAPKFTTTKVSSAAPKLSLLRRNPPPHCQFPAALLTKPSPSCSFSRIRVIKCKATEVSPPSPLAAEDGKNWVPVVPLAALPKGERRVIIQDGETILLLWYKNDVFAIENRSPAEGAYSEGLLNAKLTQNDFMVQADPFVVDHDLMFRFVNVPVLIWNDEPSVFLQDGCIICPTTDSTFNLQTGEIKEWYPKNPVLRALTPPLRGLFIYPVKTDENNIYINMGGSAPLDASTEIVFSGKAQPGFTSTDVNVDEVRMVVDENLEGFGFNRKNELINGKAAVIGFLVLLDFELLTGKGILKGTGFLDFIYSVSNALQ